MSHHATEHFLRSWVVTADFSTKNCIVLLSMFCAISSSAPHFLLGSCIKLLSMFCGNFLRLRIDVASYHRACFAQFFPCSSPPNRKLHQATEHKLRKFSSPPPFTNWCRIVLLSTFCVVELWPLIFLLKIASCYWACFAQIFSCSSFPNRKLYKATEHVLRKFSPTPPSPNWCRIIPQSMFCAIFSLLFAS